MGPAFPFTRGFEKNQGGFRAMSRGRGDENPAFHSTIVITPPISRFAKLRLCSGGFNEVWIRHGVPKLFSLILAIVCVTLSSTVQAQTPAPVKTEDGYVRRGAVAALETAVPRGGKEELRSGRSCC